MEKIINSVIKEYKSSKGRRNELTKLKYKKRLKQLGFKEGEGKFYSYRSHGKPCSCFLCRNEKYKRNSRQNIKIMESINE